MNPHVSKEHALLFSPSEDIVFFCKMALCPRFSLTIVHRLIDLPDAVAVYLPDLFVVEYTDIENLVSLLKLQHCLQLPTPFFIVRHALLPEFNKQGPALPDGEIYFPFSKRLMEERIESFLPRKKSCVLQEHSPDDIAAAEIPGFEQLVGHSHALCNLKQQLAYAAKSEITVLLLGESGTGKNLAADLIHKNSIRNRHKFFPVNMATVLENLAESELFGTEAGAYTGATKRDGFFSAADGGTLFLDEIEELSLSVQSKLLNVIEKGTYRSVGSDKEKHSDVRLILAANEDLHRMIETKKFRADLYYRINGLPIHMPSLRSRPEDIPLLAKSFLKATGKELTLDAEAKISDYNWPGNVRQLKTCLERACILFPGTVIAADNIIFD
ncbi:MAG: sigma 54-interacting transcriptional regulator [Treponema sp.]|jgi:transcriptional regulator with PAS, ATPase and Fis domain|nr:sigma 54-interacting transcriptional regulator [Treponema sp.]